MLSDCLCCVIVCDRSLGGFRVVEGTGIVLGALVVLASLVMDPELEADDTESADDGIGNERAETYEFDRFEQTPIGPGTQLSSQMHCQ